MSPEPEPGQRKPDGMTHQPLPYVVRLRVSLDDDHVAEPQDVKTIAYSVIEAVLQAQMEVTGKAEGVTCKIERVSPDLDGFARMFAEIGRSIAREKEASRGGR